MKSLRNFTVVILLLGLISIAYGQEYSYKFTPFGLTSPLLEPGEYALSIRSNYYKSEYNYTRGDSIYSSEGKDKDDYIEFDLVGTYAFSKKLIIRGDISFRPSQTVEKYEYLSQNAYGSTIGKEETESDASFNPYLNLVFKLSPYSEIVASYSYSGGADEISSVMNPAPYKVGANEYSRHFISLSFYMVGKL